MLAFASVEPVENIATTDRGEDGVAELVIGDVVLPAIPIRSNSANARTLTTIQKNGHSINSTHTDFPEARQMQVWLPLTLGSALGVHDATPPASIKLRASANQTRGSDAVQVDSRAASAGGAPVADLNGAIHLELEECL